MVHPKKQSTCSGAKSTFNKSTGSYKKEGETKTVGSTSLEQAKNTILQPKKFLTPAEMSDRRAKRLIFVMKSFHQLTT